MADYFHFIFGNPFTLFLKNKKTHFQKENVFTVG